MPKNKNGHNETHNIKQSSHYEKGRSFVDNRSQQERLAKLLFQKEKKLRKAQEAEQRARQEAEQRARREAEPRADYRGQIFGLVWAPNFDGFQQAHNQPFVEQEEQEHFNAANFRI